MPGAFQTTFGGSFFEASVTKLNAAGSALVYSTYLGGSEEENAVINRPGDIAVDASGNAYVTGQTGFTSPSQNNFPTTPGAFQTTFGGFEDAFVSKLNAVGSALLYSTYLGGGAEDYGYGIAVDALGNAYVAGNTRSSEPFTNTNFPTTPGAFQTTFGGTDDAFISKFSFATGGPALTLTPASLTFPPQAIGTTSSALQATMTNTGGAPLTFTSIGRPGDFYGSHQCPLTLQPGASCTITVTMTPTAAGPRKGNVVITDNAPDSPQRLLLTGTGSGTGSIILSLSPSSLDFGSVTMGSTSSPQTVTVTVTNIGTATASFVSPFGFTMLGTDAGDFGCQSSCGPAWHRTRAVRWR
jgi:hypothetical protein